MLEETDILQWDETINLSLIAFLNGKCETKASNWFSQAKTLEIL